MSKPYSKWKIAVISTDRGPLHYVRNQVGSELGRLGYEVVMFEQHDFEVYPKVHSHEACILALQNSDIVILLIDRRYGGLYLGRESESITEKEYFEAYDLGKIIIPCINQKAEQERFELFETQRQLMEKNGLSLEDVRSKIKPKYVDSWKVLDFIEKVRKADRDNFITHFQNSDALITSLEGRLRGLTRYICHKIIEQQTEFVKNRRTTTGFAISLGDVLDKGYFIEPPYKILSGATKSNEKASEICDLSIENKRVMIIGAPGTGKSTLLAKSFLKHAGVCLEKKSTRVPLYLSLRGLGMNYHFDFTTFVTECCQQYLGLDAFPSFDQDKIEPVFYIDGFDEIAEQFSDIDLQKVVVSKFFSSPLIVCSRTRFAEERFASMGFASRFHTILELCLWDKRLAWKYIRTLCMLHGDRRLYKKIFDAYYHTKELSQVFENPLLLTMFLWIVEESGMDLPLDAKDQASIYDRFIDLWINRELSRAGMNGLDKTPRYAESLKRAWQLSSWEIYRRRFSGEIINKQQLVEYLTSIDPDLQSISKFPAFDQFLDVRPHTEEVRGMFHEQFLEHLLAREIVSCCKNGKYPFPEFLIYEIRYEINKIIRSLWFRERRRDIDVMLRNLWKTYENHLDKKDSQSIAIRNHVMYYVGRLPHPDVKKKLKEADKLEDESFVKLSIAFGLMKLQDYEKEDELFRALVSNEDWDKANRGYHLVYYGDWILKGEQPPYFDDGSKNWTNTLRALLRHIQSTEKRHFVLRRIELFTMKRLMEARGQRTPMTVSQLKVIKSSVNCMEDKPQGFLNRVRAIYFELEKTFWKMPPV